jgi:prevent-host-death family protein
MNLKFTTGGTVMGDQCSIAEAKNKLPSIIHSVEKGSPVKLTRHGRPVAVLLSIQQYESLSLGRRSFWAALKSFRDQMKKEDIQIEEADFEGLRDASRGREVELT